MGNWGFSKNRNKPEWPKDEAGNMIPPAFLEHIGGNPVDLDMETGLLNAYGIPTTQEYPNDGVFGKIVIGHSGGGVDLYVPETLLEDAKNIISGAGIEDIDVPEEN